MLRVVPQKKTDSPPLSGRLRSAEVFHSFDKISIDYFRLWTSLFLACLGLLLLQRFAVPETDQIVEFGHDEDIMMSITITLSLKSSSYLRITRI